MERVIAKHRPIHLQNNHLLSDMQHMFTHTCTILFESMNDWTISVQSKTGISAAYIHFSRAFDRAIHVQLLQWRRNYGDRGSKLTLYPQVQDLYPLYETVPPPQVKDAAYVKILSKRFQLQDCIRFVQICTPHLRKRSDALGYLPVFIITAFRISGRLVAVAQSFSHDTYIRAEPSFTSLTS